MLPLAWRQHERTPNHAASRLCPPTGGSGRIDAKLDSVGVELQLLNYGVFDGER